MYKKKLNVSVDLSKMDLFNKWVSVITICLIIDPQQYKLNRFE